MTNTTRPLVIFSFAFGFIAVVVAFVVAMDIGWWMTIILAVLFAATVALLSWVSKQFMALRVAWHNVDLEAVKEEHRHAEKCLASGYHPNDYTPLTRQIEAPQAAPVAQLADPRREHALRLLNATLDSDKYGPKSVKVMTQKDAGAVGIIADDWSAAVSYLFLFGVATGNTGTIIKDSRNVSRLMADVARDKQDNEAGAVMALPEVVR